MKNWKIMAGIGVLALGLTGCAAYPAGPADTHYYEPTYYPAYASTSSYPAYAPTSSVGVYYYSGGRQNYRHRDYRRDRDYRRTYPYARHDRRW